MNICFKYIILAKILWPITHISDIFIMNWNTLYHVKHSLTRVFFSSSTQNLSNAILAEKRLLDYRRIFIGICWKNTFFLTFCTLKCPMSSKKLIFYLFSSQNLSTLADRCIFYLLNTLRPILVIIWWFQVCYTHHYVIIWMHRFFG